MHNAETFLFSILHQTTVCPNNRVLKGRTTEDGISFNTNRGSISSITSLEAVNARKLIPLRYHSCYSFLYNAGRNFFPNRPNQYWRLPIILILYFQHSSRIWCLHEFFVPKHTCSSTHHFQCPVSRTIPHLLSLLILSIYYINFHFQLCYS